MPRKSNNASSNSDIPNSNTEVEKEWVNHPDHYNSGKIEVIDYIEDQGLGFHLGNAIKYISRANKKDKRNTVQDLEKAIWYINRQISILKVGDE